MTIICVTSFVGSVAQGQSDSAGQSNALDPWIGKYPMSFLTKTRTANTVGKGHLSAALKVQYFDWEQVRAADGSYQDRAAGQEKQRLISTLCLKYGWAKNHHIAVGIPYWSNDFNIPGKENHHGGLANVYVFEKWRAISETNTRPAVAFDIWYYFPNGDSDRKIGADDGAVKLTTEISKAWEKFSLHFNPGYAWGLDDAPDVTEVNAGVWFNVCKQLWPAVEYNYYDKEKSGDRHDIVPGFVWRFAKGWTLKLGAPINIDSTFTDRDRIGVVMKLFRKW
jgi:hypothetical protein